METDRVKQSDAYSLDVKGSLLIASGQHLTHVISVLLATPYGLSLCIHVQQQLNIHETRKLMGGSCNFEFLT